MAEKRGYTLEEVRAYHATLRFGQLTNELASQLSTIAPSRNGRRRYYPCSVRLTDGSEVDRVYLMEARSWLESWGPMPGGEARSGGHVIQISDIDSIRESPSRLPARFADKLYLAGETGMGGTTFTVQFRDGTAVAFGTGNAVDFITYPPDKTATDVVDVLPHVGGGSGALLRAPSYSWAPFEVVSHVR
jgi:hypothetical protein